MRVTTKLLTLLTMATVLSACKSENTEAPDAAAAPRPPMPVTTLTLQAKPQALQAILPGRSRAELEAEVRPQVSGIITARLFEEGSEVRQGQPLYQIDPATFEAAVLSAKANLNRANAALATAKSRAERYEQLIKTNAISQQDLDEAQAAYLEAKAAVTVAKASINTAQINLDYTLVRAPIAGRIGRSNVTPGALVTANQSAVLTTISKLDPINVEITQSSAELLRLRSKLSDGQLSSNDNAEVALILEDGSRYPLMGELQFTDVRVDEHTGSVLLRAAFPNPEGILLPGMYVRAVVNAGIDEQAILVPQKAVTRTPRGEAQVMVINASNQVEPRIVITADVIDHQWRISEGLESGERILLDNFQKVGKGLTVTPIEHQASVGKE